MARPQGSAVVVLSLSMLLAVLGTGAAVARPADAPGQAVKVKAIIDYRNKPGKAEKVRLRTQNEARIRFAYKNINSIAVTMPQNQIAAVRARRNVRAVELDHPLTLFDHGADTGDPEIERSWGVEHTGAPRVHATGNMGSPVRAAVIDTGIYCAHQDLAANCDGGVSYIAGVSWDDDYGHGTHVSGILAGLKNGVGIVGMGPVVKLVAMKVLDSSGEGDYSGLIAALDQIATWNTDGDPANDVHVANMSIGGHEVSAALQAAVQVAADSGVILVAASGNVNPFDFYELINGCPVVYPAAYPQVLATTFTNGNDALTGYSCTGPEVDFAAPGDQVVSSVPPTGPLSASSGYLAASGTSMASPHLAGAVALLLSHGIADTNANGLRDEVTAHLCATADDGFGVLTTPIPTTDPRYPEYFGCGVPDVGTALVDDPPGGGSLPTDDPPSVDAGPDAGGVEGSAVGLSGSVIDDGSPAIAWSASDPGCTFTDATDSTTSVTCVDDGSFTLTLSADDGVNPLVTDTMTLTVANVAPVVNAGLDQAVDPGDTVTVNATFVDPGSADSHTATVDWDEGAGPEAVTPGPGSVSASHSYDDPGTYTVTVAVTDDDATGTDTLIVTVDATGTSTITFVADADAYVSSRPANKNNGSAKRLQVADGRYRSLVRFPVSGVGGNVERATLRLHVIDAGAVGNAYRITQPWAEGDVTWANQPAPGAGPYAAIDPSAPAGSWVEFDVTGAVTGDGSHSFILTDGASDVAKFQSREGSNAPELVVEYTPTASTTSQPVEPTLSPTVNDDEDDQTQKTGPKLKPKEDPKPKRGRRGQPEATPETGSRAENASGPKKAKGPKSTPKPNERPSRDAKPGSKAPGTNQSKPKPGGQSKGDQNRRQVFVMEDNPLKITRVSLVRKAKPKPLLTVALLDGTKFEWSILPEIEAAKSRRKPGDDVVAVSSRAKGKLQVTLEWPDGGGELAITFSDDAATLRHDGDAYQGRLAG